MRDQNRLKEKFQLSLDGRQVASVVVGALVILGAVFILGLNVGRQLGERERVARQPSDPLAALDTPPPSADAGEAPKLSYHEALTKSEPPRAQAPRPTPVPPRAPAPATVQGSAAAPAPPASPSARAAVEGAGPAIAMRAPPPSAPSPPEVATAHPPPHAAPQDSASEGASGGAALESQKASFAIQVGATQDIGEAQRIADRFKNHKPRIVSADIPGRGRWYRVKVGAFGTRPEAERYLADLARETSARGFVTSFK